MFKFLKNLITPEATRAPKRQQHSRARKSRSDGYEDTQPSVLPQVTEGNDHTDWSLWEDSVAALDSQMQDLTPSVNIYRKEPAAPSEYQDIDVFAKVKRKDP